jgi:hypothetical protein
MVIERVFNRFKRKIRVKNNKIRIKTFFTQTFTKQKY